MVTGLKTNRALLSGSLSIVFEILFCAILLGVLFHSMSGEASSQDQGVQMHSEN